MAEKGGFPQQPGVGKHYNPIGLVLQHPFDVCETLESLLQSFLLIVIPEFDRRFKMDF